MRRFFRPIPLIISALAVLCIYTLAGFFLVPYIIKAYVLPKVSDQLRRPVLVKEVEFNPFVLSLKLTEFEIQEPDSTPLIGFQEFFVNFQTSSIFRRAYVFDQIRFAIPFASVKVMKDGRVNLADLASPADPAAHPQSAKDAGQQPSKDTDQKPAKNADQPKELPAIQIGRFEIAQGVVEFRDESKPKPVSIDIVPINLILRNFYTKPGGDNAYAFKAELGKNEVLDWKGTISLEPIHSEGTLSLNGVKLATLFQYVQDRFNFEIPTGTIEATGQYRFDATTTPIDIEVSDTSFHFADIGLAEKGDSIPVITVPTLNVDGIHVDLRQRTVSVESITMSDATNRVWRNRDGSLNLQTLLMPVNVQSGDGEASAAPKASSSSAPWTVSISQAGITNHTIHFEDRSLALPMRTDVTQLSAKTHDVVFPFKGPIPLTVEYKLNETGAVLVDGQIMAKPLQLDMDVALGNIAIQPFQPYFEQFARIAVDNGAIDLDGKLHLAVEHPKAPLMTFQGNLGVKSLAIADRDQGNPIASWKQFQLRDIALAVDPTSISIEEVGVNQPTVHLVVSPDGEINVKKVLVTSSPRAEKKPQPKKSPPPSVTIKTVKVLRGTATFEDESIKPPVQTGLYDLTGTVKGLSSKQIAKADVDLSGKIDKVAPLKITGMINPLTEDAFTDLTIKFDNVDLTTAAPYSGKYVGYPIQKGKLFLDLVYKVSQKQLEAENKVAVDQLTFGEKTDSPDATSLPVPLAVALLKDRQGRIDIDLPIRGDLKDPDFKYGKAVWSTLGNILTKMVASPFALIGKLAPEGGSGEELQQLVFEPGSTAIAPTEMKKIAALKKGLEERPGLRLEITGTADPARDRQAVALQKFHEQLESKWRQKNGSSTQAVDIPTQEEERLITELFDQWRSQQPEPLQAADTPAKPPSIEDMKRELVKSIPVDEGALRALARTRAEQVHAQIVGDGKLPEERVFMTDVDLATTDKDKVPSRLNITAGS
jgi:uncharacterized protein involved in outer membrane biogenesis